MYLHSEKRKEKKEVLILKTVLQTHEYETIKFDKDVLNRATVDYQSKQSDDKSTHVPTNSELEKLYRNAKLSESEDANEYAMARHNFLSVYGAASAKRWKR
ncbi:hypothetical protein ACFVV6_17000 [Bacillus mycoides]|uniref:hypothetical protein n=1 Tax=Bacillus mycoides TaxID=1405 RepID=UPI00365EAB4C